MKLKLELLRSLSEKTSIIRQQIKIFQEEYISDFDDYLKGFFYDRIFYKPGHYMYSVSVSFNINKICATNHNTYCKLGLLEDEEIYIFS